MDEHPGVATVQLGKHRPECGVAEIGAADVGQQGDAVDVEAVVAVGDLGDRPVHVGDRQRSELPEPARMVDDGAVALLVHGRARSRAAASAP